MAAPAGVTETLPARGSHYESINAGDNAGVAIADAVTMAVRGSRFTLFGAPDQVGLLRGHGFQHVEGDLYL